MKDAGILTLCRLENVAEPGGMPRERLVEGNRHFYEERMVGYGRQYAAMGANEQVDVLARIWRDSSARIGMYAVLSDYEGQEHGEGDQYRVDNVQHRLDEDGLKVTDLTLSRLDSLYDVAGG